MSLMDELAKAAAADIEERRVLHLSRDLSAAKVRVAEESERRKFAESELSNLQREFDILRHLSDNRPPVYGITPKSRVRGNRAIPHLLLSDLHLDEVVSSAEVEGMNSYNRAIAVKRLQRTFTGAVAICNDYWTNITYDGFHVLMAGDTFSGFIHEELKETNEDTMLGSMLFWQDKFLSGLRLLADTFGKVHVSAVPGNHGRSTRKPRSKFRARDNFDWYFASQLAILLRDDKRFTFNVPESMDATIVAYSHKIRLTHGDQGNGGKGIGGIWPVVMRLDARKKQRQSTVGNPYDLLAMGHYHQLTFGPAFVINGAMKGYDEYAYGENFGYEPAQQALWLMTPEHGKTFTAPVVSQDRKAEGW